MNNKLDKWIRALELILVSGTIIFIGMIYGQAL